MRNISGTTGSSGYGETSWEAGNSAEIASRKESQALINRADSISLLKIFKLYGVKIDEYCSKAICPFKFHKNGMESTPSFNYFSSTNSFYCYGCKAGSPYSKAVAFVAYYENISKDKAAAKILSKFSTDDCNVSSNYVEDNFDKKIEIMMKFSKSIREFRDLYNDDKSYQFIENICKVYDKHYIKHNPSIEALEVLVDELIKRIDFYKCKL